MDTRHTGTASGSREATGNRTEELHQARIQRTAERMRTGFLTAGVLVLVGLFFVLIFGLVDTGEKPAEQQAAQKDAQAEQEAASEQVASEPEKSESSASSVDSEQESRLEMPKIDLQLLTVNEYSRPGTPLNEVVGVVVHYTANPQTTAQQNRDYFQAQSIEHLRRVSSHFVIGLEGEIIQCIPTAEMSYASNDRNIDTVSIECCHEDETGKFTEATYQSLAYLTAYLCQKYDLNSEDVIRHYDVTGKLCPKYFVEHEDAWAAFKADVQDYLDGEKDVDQSLLESGE